MSKMVSRVFRGFLSLMLLSAAVLLAYRAKAQAVLSLIDVDFGSGTSTTEVGFAATGQTSSDFWNFYTRDNPQGGYLQFGFLANLKYADGTASGAGLTISNAAGSWGTGAADYMYDGYLYPSVGGNILVVVTNLAAGSYDFYVYGHGAANNQNSTYQLSVNSQSYGGMTTLNGPGWDSSAVWQNGLQYVEFSNVTVNAGQTVAVTVLPASSSYAIIAGMQIAESGPMLVAPVVTNQPPSQAVTAGANVTFTVGVSGSLPLSYQWQYGGSNISGATASSLTLNNVQVSDSGNYSVTVSNVAGSTTSSNAVLTVNPVVVSTNNLPLIDVDFGGGAATSEVGFAATGQSANDFWNFYTRDDGQGGYLSFGSLANLKNADGSASGAGLTITDAPGAWGNGAADYMYDGYLYPFDGGNIIITVTNLAAATYDFYLYGHGDADNQNSTYQVSVDGQSYGSQTTLSGPGWGSSAVWQEGLQYVVISNVVVGAGQTVTVTVSPAASSYAIISGMQMAQVTASAPVAPMMTSQPASQTVAVGANVSFSVGVSGSLPLSYQWQYGGNSISGATGSSLALNNVQVSDSGNYSVIVSNAGGSATSSNAVLTVNTGVVSTNALPLIDVQFCALENPNSLKDRKTGFAAVGQTSNDYWNAYSRDGANGSFLTYGVLNNLELADGSPTAVNLTVANAPGAWSNGSSDPMYATYLYPFDGGDITVTVSNLDAGTYSVYLYGHGAADDQNSTYELSVDGQSNGSQSTLDGPGWNNVVWEPGIQFVEFQNVSINAGQGVTITVSPGAGGYAVISGLQIAQAVASTPVAPNITTQPASQTVTVGANITFTVGVTGSFPLSYQWQYGGNNISGATGASLTLNNVQVSDSGNYSVTVSNVAGSTTSSNAVLTVNPVVVSTNNLPLIDVDFGSGTATSEVGFAATGQSASDFWNFYTRDDGQGGYLSFGSLANLKNADGSASGAGLTIGDAPGAWGNGATDYMYDGYLYPFDGGNIIITVTNLPAATYDFYLYGHGEADNQNSTYQVSVDGQSYGGQTTLNGPGWDSSAVWQEGLQYVVISNVVVGAGQTVTVTVSPAASSYAIISGMQMAQVTAVAPVAPTVTSQPASQTVMVGANVSFSVGVSGSLPLSYQWQYGGNSISGATGSSLTLNDVQVSNAGNYSVTVSNVAGSATSSNAVLVVSPIVYTPVASNQVVALIENTSVDIVLTGSIANGDPLTYTVVGQPSNGTLSGSAPNLTYQPAANYAGPDSFTFTANDGTNSSAPATVSINVLAQTFGSLIDVAFGSGTSTAKVGFAATGQNANDFWNFYSRDEAVATNGTNVVIGWRTFGVLSNLDYADGTPSGAELTITNAPGAWGNGSSDPMYNSYLYPFNGSNIVVTVSNLAAGTYAFYIYGHGAADDQNCTYQLNIGGQSYGSQTTAGPGWSSPIWQQGLQYVEFQGVSVAAGQVATITVLPGPGGYAVISGLQLAQAAPPQVAIAKTGNQQSLLFNPSSRVTNTVPPPMLYATRPVPKQFGFTFAGAVGHAYRVDASDDPGSGKWTPIAVITVNQSPYTFTDPDTTARTKRFYRIVAVPK